MAGGQLANIFSFERSANLSLLTSQPIPSPPLLLAQLSTAGIAPAFRLDEGFHLKTETNAQVSSLKSF